MALWLKTQRDSAVPQRVEDEVRRSRSGEACADGHGHGERLALLADQSAYGEEECGEEGGHLERD